MISVGAVFSKEMYVTFHEQHSSGYGFPSLLLAKPLVLKNNSDTPAEAHVARSSNGSAVHGKSFHKGLTKRSIIFM